MFSVFLALMALFASAALLDVVQPVVEDTFTPVTLRQRELGGELNRRIALLIDRNYMVLDMDSCWLNHFQNRTDRNGKEAVYYGIGKVIDAGSIFAQYSDDPAVAKRTQYLIDGLVASRDPDGYVGFWSIEPGNLQNYMNWILHEQD